jgi:hypothetical protein
MEGPQGADSFPEAVDCPGYFNQDLSFHLGHEFSSGFRANTLEKFARIFHP